MDQQAGVSPLRAVSRHRPPHGAAGRFSGDNHAQNRPFYRCRHSWSVGPPGPRPAALGVRVRQRSQNQWLPIQELQAKVEALGYKVQKAKLAKTLRRVYTIDKNGRPGRTLR